MMCTTHVYLVGIVIGLILVILLSKSNHDSPKTMMMVASLPMWQAVVNPNPPVRTQKLTSQQFQAQNIAIGNCLTDCGANINYNLTSRIECNEDCYKRR